MVPPFPAKKLADRVFQQVLEAMQDAENIGIEEEEEYLALMERIIEECRQRMLTQNRDL